MHPCKRGMFGYYWDSIGFLINTQRTCFIIGKINKWLLMLVIGITRSSIQVLLCLFPGVLWLGHFLYSVGSHPVSGLQLYTFVVSRAFMAGAASQAATLTPPGHLWFAWVRECPPWCSIVGATVTVHQFFCILH